MKKAKLLLTVASLLSVCSLTSCGKKYDVTLTVYNSEDYIYLGEDED